MLEGKKSSILLCVGTVIYLVMGVSYLMALVNQGRSLGVEITEAYSMAQWNLEKLQQLGVKSSILGMALMIFGFLKDYDRVKRNPLKGFLIILLLSAPVAMLIQLAVPAMVSRGLVAAFPEKAQQAVDAYYAKRLLVGGHAMIPGLPGFDNRRPAVLHSDADTQKTFFTANLYFMLPDVAKRIQPSYTREELPLAYLYHLRYPQTKGVRVDFNHLTAAQQVQLRQDVKEFLAPVDDIERMKQMVFIPYAMMVSTLLLAINVVIGLSTLLSLFLMGRNIRWINWVAAFLVLGSFPIQRPSAISASEAYKAILANGDVTLLGSGFSAGMLQFEISAQARMGWAFSYAPNFLAPLFL